MANPLSAHTGELTNDDPTLTRTTPLEAHRPVAGLDLGEAMRPASAAPDFGALNAQADALMADAMPRPMISNNQTPALLYSPSTGELFVNGFRFNQNHAGNALASLEAADAPPSGRAPPSDVADWRPMSRSEYDNYIESIRNPSFGRRMGEAWQNAMRGWADTHTGAVLMVDPDNEWATNMRATIAEGYARDAPYMTRFRDINTVQEGIDWTAQALIQGGPWLLDSLAWMAAGALVGGAVSGGVGAVPGAISGIAARTAARQAAAVATRNVIGQNVGNGARAYQRAAQVLRRPPTIDEAIRHGAARTGASEDDVRRFYSFAERSFHMSRGGQFGAIAATGASNYAVGVGDIRNTLVDSGVDPDEAGFTATVLGGALPYALLETVGDLLIAQPITDIIPGMRRGATRLGNSLRGAATGFAAESVTETGQDIVLEASRANMQGDFNLDPIDLLEAGLAGGLAGAGMGGAVGAVATPDRSRPAGLITDGRFNLPDGTNPEPVTPDAPITPAAPETSATLVAPTSPDAQVDAPLGGELTLQDIQRQLSEMERVYEAPVSPRPQEVEDEIERLRNALVDPRATPEQRQAADDALSILLQQAPGQRDERYQSAADSRARATRGVTPVEDEAVTGPNMIDANLSPPPLLQEALETSPDPLTEGKSEQAINAELGLEETPENERPAPLTGRQVIELREQVGRNKKLIKQLNSERASLKAGPELSAVEAKIAQTRQVLDRAEGLLRRRIPLGKIGQPAPQKPPVVNELAEASEQSLTSAEANELGGYLKALNAGTLTQEQAKRAVVLAKRLETIASTPESKASAAKSIASFEAVAAGRQLPQPNVELRGRTEEAAPAKVEPTAEEKLIAENRALLARLEKLEKTVEETDKRVDVLSEIKKLRDQLTEATTNMAKDADARDQTLAQERPVREERPAAPVREEKPVAPAREEKPQTPSRIKTAVENLKAGVAENRIKSPLQAIRAMISVLNKNRNIRQPWAIIDGKPLTKPELDALLVEFQDDPAAPTTADIEKRQEKKAKADDGKQYLADLLARIAEDKGTNKTVNFNEYVLSDTKAAREWLQTPAAKTERPAIAVRVENILGKLPKFDPPQQMARTLSEEDLALIAKADALVGPDYENMFLIGTPQDIELLNAAADLLNKAGVDKKKASEFANIAMWARRGNNAVRGTRQDLKAKDRNKFEPPQQMAGKRRFPEVYAALTEFMIDGVTSGNLKYDSPNLAKRAARYLADQGLVVPELYTIDRYLNEITKLRSVNLGYNPQKMSREVSDGSPLDYDTVLKMATDFNNKLHPELRFAEIKVFRDDFDFSARMGSEFMTFVDGNTYTIQQYLAALGTQEITNPNSPHFQKPLGETIEIIMQEDLSGMAMVVPNFDTMFVFADMHNTRRELLESLEHEAIGHRGLDVLFDSKEEKQAWLARLARIPGMRAKLQELLRRRPSYTSTSVTNQLEEVIMLFGLEQGPLASEAILSAPETIDAKTGRTLWKDLLQRIVRWVRDIFGDKVPNEQRALNAIAMALRKYALTEEVSDLYGVIKPFVTDIDPETGAPWRPIPETAVGRFSAPIQRVRDMEQTIGDLFEIENPTNTSQAYSGTSFFDHARRMFTADGPLLDKARDFASKAAGTSINEAWSRTFTGIESIDNKAQRSALIDYVYNTMNEVVAYARTLMHRRAETRAYALKAKETAWMRGLFGDKDPGSTREQREAFAQIAILATSHFMPLASADKVKEAPRLAMNDANGMLVANPYAVNGMIGKEDPATGEWVPGPFMLTKQQLYDGVEQFYIGANDIPISAGVKKLSKEIIDAGYDMYVEETKHNAWSIFEVFDAKVTGMTRRRDSTIQRLLREGKLKGADAEFTGEALQRIYRLYADIAFNDYRNADRRTRIAQRNKARDVAIELMRAFHEPQKVLDWTDMSRVPKEKEARNSNAFVWRERNETTKPYWSQIEWFLSNDPTTGKSRISRMNTVGVSEGHQLKMFGAFQTLINAEIMTREDEKTTIHTIMGNYIELSRDGRWRVFMEAVDAATGKKVKLNADFQNALRRTHTESKREADLLQEVLKEAFNGTYTMQNVDGEEIQVRLAIGVERAPRTSSLADAPNLRQFTELAEIIGVKLSPSQVTRIAELVESAEGRKRFGMQRIGTPGFDADILQNNNDLFTRRAWQAAKALLSWDIERVMADDRYVHGDWAKLEELQRTFDEANNAPVRNEDAVYEAERRLKRYAWQMKHMARSTTERSTVDYTTTAGKVSEKIVPEGNAYREDAIALIESLNKGQLEVNVNDLLSKTGGLRLSAAVMHLGNFASGFANAFVVVTHLPHVLAANHKRTGYGEGFQYSEVTQGIINAMSDLGINPKLVESKYVRELRDAARAGKNTTNLSLDELEFLYTETLRGKLMPNQTYSMSGGTESSLKNVWLRNVVETFLMPFSVVDAAARRWSAITTYRLAKQRYIRAGVSEAALNDHTSPEYKRLVADIEYVLTKTNFDYNNVNSPEFFRGDLAMYILMYKKFAVMTVQMIYNLPTAQQAAVLWVFFMLGGLKGEPFAEDFMDLYDTMMQKLGFKHDSIELQATRFFDEIMPGSAPIIMRGFADNLFFGGTLSTRFGMGDIIPMTGAFREGADFNRELSGALGATWTANQAQVEYAFVLSNFVAQLIGVREYTGSWADLARKMPQSGLRGLGEAALQLNDREITDRDGRVISDDNVGFFSIFSRALGFYPIQATRANDAIRLDRYHTGYMKAVRARYVLAHANAYRTGDTEGMRRIERYVNDWNAWAREANREDMEITNFRNAARTAGERARQVTIERASDSAADYSVVDEFADILNADEEAED